MSSLLLTRGALARVLQSLLETELRRLRLGSVRHGESSPTGLWPDDLYLDGSGSNNLACDSLEILWLSAAVNEMFHLHESQSETDLLSAHTFGQWLDVIESCWSTGVTRITFATSGSTGPPKRCTHEIAYLQIEIDYLSSLFKDRKRILCFTRAHHIYGFLFTALLADRLGVEVISATGMGASEFHRQLKEGDLVVSIPDRWQWLSRSLPKWPSGIEGVVSTAPCPAGLISSVMGRGLARMTEIYGSSETAGVAIRVWPEETYRLMPQWQFHEDPDLGQMLRHTSGTQLAPMDKLVLYSSDSFTLGGRRDLSEQVGGTNVHCDRIAASIRALPGVADAAVRLMRPSEGTRLKVFIVPKPGLSEEKLRGELQSWVETNLPVPERPKAFTFGDRIPETDSGGVGDW